MLFVRVIIKEDPPFDAQQTAMEIYAEFQKEKDETQIFLTNTKRWKASWIEKVKKEFERIESEVIAKMMNENPQKPADITTTVTSKILDTGVVFQDILKWRNGDPSNSMTWAEFKASFEKE